MTTVLICRNAPTDSCHNLTALMPRCTKPPVLLTPHYVCAHRNSDNLHNAVFIRYSLVARVMADEHLIVVLRLQDKSSSLGPHAVRAMMNDGDDVLHVNVGTGLTTAHLASLIHADNATVYAIGVGSEVQRNRARQNIELLGAKCILASRAIR